METPNISYIGAFVAGLLSFLSPCVLPLIPSYITYITGLSFGDLDAEHPTQLVRRKTLLHSLSFVAGFTIVFVLLGASATLLGNFMQQHMDLIRKLGGVLVVLFGIHVTGLVPLKWLLGERRVSLKHKPAGYLGSLLVGLAFAAGWTPCIGPILASILMIAATKETLLQGTALVVVFGLAMTAPFVVAAAFARPFLLWVSRHRRLMGHVEKVMGAMLLVFAVLIATDSVSLIAAWLIESFDWSATLK